MGQEVCAPRRPLKSSADLGGARPEEVRVSEKGHWGGRRVSKGSNVGPAKSNGTKGPVAWGYRGKWSFVSAEVGT